jgi:hypothetical protein
MFIGRDDMARDDDKLEGHRKAIQEHIEKYKAYSSKSDKNFALKTIRRIQSEIADILKDHPHWGGKREDDWMP